MTDIGDTSHNNYTTTIPHIPLVSQPVNKPNSNNIPAELKSLNHWTLWRYERNSDGKEGKVPYQINGKKAKINDSSTWASFEAVWDVYEQGNYSGVQFALTKDDPYAVIDLDRVVAEDGTIDRRADKLVKSFKSYTEESPSGRGMHICIKAVIPRNKNTKSVEMYDSNHFITFTGKRVSDYYYSIESVSWAYSELFGTDSLPSSESSTFTGVADTSDLTEDDKRLIEKMFSSKSGKAIKNLWEGDTSKHGGDNSNADIALCGYLAWWCNFDIQRTDRLFRHSQLMRNKWDESRGEVTYGEMTLGKVFDGKKPGDGHKQSVVDTTSEDTSTNGLAFTDYFSVDAAQVIPPSMLIGAPFSIPLGFVAAIGGLGGTGKSTLAARLAISVALGVDFLGAKVDQGNAVYLDFELDASVTIPRFKALCRGLDVPPEALKGRLEYKSLTADGVLFPGILADLEVTLETLKPKLVIIDAYQAAFGGDATDRERVPENIKTLVGVASRHGCTVLYLDHKSKDQKGFSSSTLYGSVYKQNFARMVALLSETDSGILKYQTVKANFSAKAPPLGIKCDWTQDDWGESLVRYRLADLDESTSLTGKEAVENAAVSYLEENMGQLVTRKRLVETIQVETGTSLKYCEKVLNTWLTEQVKDKWLEEKTLEGRGSPKGYILPNPLES